MSLPRTSGGQGVGPGQGEALWFNGALAVLRATGGQTEGRYAVLELLAPKGFASPLHIHRREDEFFVVLSGEVRVQHGDAVMEAVAGTIVFGPRGIAYAFHVDSARPGFCCSSDPPMSSSSIGKPHRHGRPDGGGPDARVGGRGSRRIALRAWSTVEVRRRDCLASPSSKSSESLPRTGKREGR